MDVHYADVVCTVIQGHRATIVRAEALTDYNIPYISATGEALRHPTDKHDDEVAVLLATGRALEALGRKLTKRANGKVKSIDDNARRSNTGNTTGPGNWEWSYHTDAGLPRCQGTKVSGGQCSRTATQGTYCRTHQP